MYKVQGFAGCSGLRVVQFRDDFRIYGSASTQKMEFRNATISAIACRLSRYWSGTVLMFQFSKP